ncbi:MAG: hypothetical protein PHQ75_10400 [Thermoguttaceae bacterium]|nr:hypothetical protein [Thermoguttaceae bacterium]
MKRKATLLFLIVAFFSWSAFGADLKIGSGTVDFTPPRPVSLDGQMGTRISKKAITPITANILALEGTNQKGRKSCCVIVSCDMVGIRPEFENAIRTELKKLLPDFDLHNVMLCATHTHTAPVADDNKYYINPKYDCMPPGEFVAFASKPIADGIARAWNNRKPAKFSYGLGQAFVAQCRRSVYANGQARMYGKTNESGFRNIEAFEDRDVNTMFFHDASGKLLAAVVNVSCPAQEVESLSNLHADYWHFVREYLHKIWGPGVVIVALCGAAGDMSPHTQYRKVAEDRMSQLRGLTRVEEIGRRVAVSVADVYETVKDEQFTNIPFEHTYAVLDLPQHRITQSEYEQSKAEAALLKDVVKKDPNRRRLLSWAQTIVDRYGKQQSDPNASFKIPVHVLRIGDTAVCSNPFELFTSFGTQIKSRCAARQTFVVQLTDGCGICGTASSAGYLPTREAYAGGGYSAIVKSISVGPDGGQKLVEETLDLIDPMFK